MKKSFILVHFGDLGLKIFFNHGEKSFILVHFGGLGLKIFFNHGELHSGAFWRLGSQKSQKKEGLGLKSLERRKNYSFEAKVKHQF